MSVLRTRKEVLTANEVGSWLSCAEDHATTTAIELPGTHLNDDIAALIGILVMHCTKLRTINLAENEITDAGADFLARHLAESPCMTQGCVLSHLDLRANRITARGAEEVARVFLLGGVAQSGGGGSPEKCSSSADEAEAGERVLDLSQNRLEDAGVAAVARCLVGRSSGPSRKRGVVRLRLRDVGCSDQGLKAVLSFKDSLAELDVASNPLGLTGVESICRAVCGGAPWHTLSLAALLPEASTQRKFLHSSTKIWKEARSQEKEKEARLGPDLAVPLSKCMGHLSGLRSLDCSGNRLGDTGCQLLVDALPLDDDHFRLEHLALAHNACGHLAAGALREVLLLGSGEGRSGLRQLRLQGNCLNDGCASRLAEGLDQNTTLQELNLAHNQIMCKGATSLAQALQAQRRWAVTATALADGESGCLVHLNLSANPVGDDGAEALAKATSVSADDLTSRTFQAPWGLEKLVLEDTQIHARGRSALCMAVAARAALIDASLNGFVGEQAAALHASLQSRAARQPAGLHVYGLVLDDREAVVMRDGAHAHLRALWPAIDENRERRVQTGSRPRSSSGTGSASIANFSSGFQIQADETEWSCNMVLLQDFEVDENYFDVPLDADDSRITPLGDFVVRPPSYSESLLSPLLGRGDPSAASSSETPPTGKGKGKGKGPPKPRRATIDFSDLKGKGKGFLESLAKPKAKSSDLALTPFGRRIHWVEPTYEEPDSETLFGELYQEEQEEANSLVEGSDRKQSFDSTLLSDMLGGGRKDKKTQRGTLARAPTGIAVLTATRAQNMAIVLGKLAVSSEEMCECLQELDFSDPRLTYDNIELLMSILPTPEETKKLKEHREAPELLRDIEQKVMPFCILERSVPRLKLMKVFLSHESTYTSIRQRCMVLSSAADELRKSKCLKKVLSIVLRICNFINHETGSKTKARGFAMESLKQLASFKMGSVSTIHFLCLTMRASDASFLETLKRDLRHIHKASREKTAALEAAIEAFDVECAFCLRELEQLKESDEDGSNASPIYRMEQLCELLEDERGELAKVLERALRICSDVKRYFMASDKKGQASSTPYEQFFSHFVEFVDQVEAAWVEIERQPAAWRKFTGAGDKVGSKGKGLTDLRKDRQHRPAARPAVDRQGRVDRQNSPRPGSTSSPRPGSASTAESESVEADCLPKDRLRRWRTEPQVGSRAASVPEAEIAPADITPARDPLRQRALTYSNLLQVPGSYTPSAGAAPSDCGASDAGRSAMGSYVPSTAGSDVGFMMDIDDLMDSIFSLCGEEEPEAKQGLLKLPAPVALPSQAEEAHLGSAVSSAANSPTNSSLIASFQLSQDGELRPRTNSQDVGGTAASSPSNRDKRKSIGTTFDELIADVDNL